MGQKRMSSSLVKLIDDLQELKSANFAWKDFDEKIEGIGLKIKKKDFEALCINKDIYDKAFHSSDDTGKWTRGRWVAQRAVEHLLPFHVTSGDKILKESEIDEVKVAILQHGIYKDISIIDEVAKNGSGNSQVLAATFCSIKALRTLSGNKSAKIRKVYYNRLGPVECLDEMLSDSIADIRYEGIARAPYFYNKLNSLVKEIARGPFSLLIEKIPLDYLPMLVANRNVKNNWISRKFERRISSGR